MQTVFNIQLQKFRYSLRWSIHHYFKSFFFTKEAKIIFGDNIYCSHIICGRHFQLCHWFIEIITLTFLLTYTLTLTLTLYRYRYMRWLGYKYDYTSPHGIIFFDSLNGKNELEHTWTRLLFASISQLKFVFIFLNLNYVFLFSPFNFLKSKQFPLKFSFGE